MPAPQLLDDALDVPGVLADELICECGDDVVDTPDRARRVAFPEPMGVSGPDLEQEAGADDAHGRRLDAGGDRGGRDRTRTAHLLGAASEPSCIGHKILLRDAEPVDSANV